MSLKKSLFQEVVNFFVSRGYLYAENYSWVRTIKLSNALKAGDMEPRILAVLPAAMLRSKRSIEIDISLPKDLKSTIDALKAGKADHPDFRGIPFSEIKRWSNLKTNDKRSKPQDEKRILKSFRFKPETIKILKDKARELGQTETNIIENLILETN